MRDVGETLKPVCRQQELERAQSGALSQSSTPVASSSSGQHSAAAKAWGTLLSAFALVARHDPRPRVADTAGAAMLVSRAAWMLTDQPQGIHIINDDMARLLLVPCNFQHRAATSAGSAVQCREALVQSVEPCVRASSPCSSSEWLLMDLRKLSHARSGATQSSDVPRCLCRM